MSDERCDETRDLLPEIALGIADGAERARVLAHVADCSECRRELERQSAIADELLVLAPEEEPPVGFELGVLGSMQPPAPPPRRRSIVRPLAVAAVVALAIAITAGAMQVNAREDRRLADHYRATLAQANGTYFGARRLADPAGRVGGVAFVYQGSPSWIVITVDPAFRASVADAEVVDRGGRRIPLRAFRLAGGAWGGALPLDLGAVAAVHLTGEDGRSVLVANL
jgi:Putative zinc-finger